MRKSIALTLLFAAFFTCVHAQIQLVSSTRMEELKLGLPVDTINKIVNGQIPIKKQTKEFVYDTVNIIYKSDSVRLVFSRFLSLENKVQTSLVSIFSKAKGLKTRSGIKPGDNKFDIIKKLDGASMRISPDWHFAENDPERKPHSVVVLYDYENDSLLNFYFYNNSLYGFECSSLQEGG